jgi:hypothetical protein
MTDRPIVQGSFQNPYQQFEYTIPANGGQLKIAYAFNFFRCLEASDTFKVRFGGTGAITQFVGAGLGFRLNEVIQEVLLINDTASPIDITVALAVGEIFDDRLNVSGNINVVNAAGTFIEVLTANNVIQSENSTTVGNGATVQLITGATDQTGAIIQNQGPYDLFLGSTSNVANLQANGIKIEAGQTYTYEGAYAIRAVTLDGDTTVRYKRIGRA